MTTLYGISNCDTVRKARRWLEEQQIDYQFHDFRKDGLTRETLSDWLSTTGYDKLLNRRSTSWRAVSEADRNELDQERAIALMLQTPTLIKRPVLSHRGEILIGFSTSDYQTLLLGQ